MPAEIHEDSHSSLFQDGPAPRVLLTMPQRGSSSDSAKNLEQQYDLSTPRERTDSDATLSTGVEQRWLKRYRVEVAASGSSVLSTLTTFPLDSVKTRMQTYKYAGFLDCVRQTYQKENLRGFFRGVTAPMASITLVRTVSFSIYQRSKYAYSNWVKRNFGFDVMAHVASQGSYPNLWSIATFAAAGATAGSCITVIACRSFKRVCRCVVLT